MSENEKEINLIDSAMSESGFGSMNPSLSVSELEGQLIQTADSNIQSVTENNITESIIINNAEAKSTPVVTKIKEKELSMNDMFNLMQTMSENMNSNFNKQSNDFNEKFDKINSRLDVNDTKIDKLSNDINEQKIKCEQQNVKNDTNFKEQNIKFEKSINFLLYTSICV